MRDSNAIPPNCLLNRKRRKAFVQNQKFDSKCFRFDLGKDTSAFLKVIKSLFVISLVLFLFLVFFSFPQPLYMYSCSRIQEFVTRTHLL